LVGQLVFSKNKSNKRVQNPKVSALFGSIPILWKEISNIKNGEPTQMNQFSDVVTQIYESSNFLKDFQSLSKLNKDCLLG